MSIIEVNNVTKEYRLGQIKSLRQSVMSSFDRLRGRRVVEQVPFKALDNVHFKVEEGEVLGIIGTNGAGKSTLLKLLARISAPTKGSIKVYGSVAPLIEVGAGLHPELTGRENIYLNATILGVKRAEIKKRFDDIVQFAELEDFIDTPVKRYSSGMSVRLGFSIATSINADILIVDEVLAVGDLAFQRKCFDRIERMIKRQGKTVLIVGHNIRQMERICSRMMLLDRGLILLDGKPSEVGNAYYNMTTQKVELQCQHKNGHLSGQINTGEIEVLDLQIYHGHETTPAEVIPMHESARIGIRFRANIDIPVPEISVGIHTSDFVYVALANSAALSDRPDISKGIRYLECCLEDVVLKPGTYSIRLVIFDQFRHPLWMGENLRSFRVVPGQMDVTKLPEIGLVDLPFKWNFIGFRAEGHFCPKKGISR